jgi:hypothetical protein
MSGALATTETSPDVAVWLDVKGAARRIVASEATVLRAARAGLLQGYKLGRGRKVWRFRPADVDAFVMAGVTPMPANGRQGEPSSC